MEVIRPDPSYFVLHEDGSTSSEIFDYPPLSKMFQTSFEYKNLCVMERKNLTYDSDSEIFKWILAKNSGITISIVFSSSKTKESKENYWLKRRGFGGIFGDVMLTALSLNRSESQDHFIPVKGALEIVISSLSSRNKTFSDCIVHAERRMNGKKNVSVIRDLVARRGRAKPSPDDSPRVRFTKACCVCKRKKNDKETIFSCPCGRVYYCGKICQRKHWGEHKFVHRDSLGTTGVI